MSETGFILWRASDRRYYIAVAVLTALLAALVTLLTVVFYVGRVDGPSMESALHDGEYILVTRDYNAPRRGDIVSIRVRERSGEFTRMIKRVVALAGDDVAIVGDVVYVNGEESAVAPLAILGDSADRIDPFTVPAGTVYVLGDNRPEALDSRITGPIPLDAIVGKAEYVILPLSAMRAIDEPTAAP